MNQDALSRVIRLLKTDKIWSVSPFILGCNGGYKQNPNRKIYKILLTILRKVWYNIYKDAAKALEGLVLSFV